MTAYSKTEMRPRISKSRAASLRPLSHGVVSHELARLLTLRDEFPLPAERGRVRERIPRKPSSRLAALNLVAAEVMRRKELSPKGIRLVTSAATNRRFMGRGAEYQIVF